MLIDLSILSPVEKINIALQLLDPDFSAREITGEFPYKERKGRVFGLYYQGKIIASYSSIHALKKCIIQKIRGLKP